MVLPYIKCHIIFLYGLAFAGKSFRCERQGYISGLYEKHLALQCLLKEI